MAKKINEYDFTKSMLDVLRDNKKYSLLKEEDEHKKDDDKNDKKKDDDKEDKLKNAIAITDDPKFGQQVLSQQIEQFKNAVDSGAEFSEGDKKKVSSSPLIYLPENGNLIFSGIIPRLNNLKFQFLLKTNTGNGCFAWADGLVLNDENFKTLSKLYGFYQNWCDAWNAESKDFKTIVDTEKERKK